MGNDGGSIPDRRDLVRNKPKAEQADKANQTRARWFFCALSKKPLQEPIVSCALGKLYNKDALLEYLLDRTAYGDGDEICGHIRSLKDVKTLKLTHNPVKPSGSTDTQRDVARFVCPLNFKEMIGSQPFVYIWTCGCVFSQAGLRAVSKSPPPSTSEQKELDMCPQCGAKYDRVEDVLILNPSLEEEEKMILAMTRRRAAEPTKSKSKGNKKRKAAALLEGANPPANKRKNHASASPAPTLNPSIAAASRAVVHSLAEEEAKRKASMSDAVKSLYQPKDGVKTKETFMTMGTFTRYA